MSDVHSAAFQFTDYDYSYLSTVAEGMNFLLERYNKKVEAKNLFLLAYSPRFRSYADRKGFSSLLFRYAQAFNTDLLAYLKLLVVMGFKELFRNDPIEQFVIGFAPLDPEIKVYSAIAFKSNGKFKYAECHLHTSTGWQEEKAPDLGNHVLYIGIDERKLDKEK